MKVAGRDRLCNFLYLCAGSFDLDGLACGLDLALVAQVVEDQLLRMMSPGDLRCQSIYRKLQALVRFVLVLGDPGLVINNANAIVAEIVHAIDASGDTGLADLDVEASLGRQ